MISNEQIKAIANSIDVDKYNFDYIGIRVQEELHENVGDLIRHNSKVWVDGEETDEELNGVCAINAKTTQYLSKWGGYSGKVVIVIGSDYAQDGQDEEELIMKDAVILEVITNK